MTSGRNVWHSTDVPWRPAQEPTARAFPKKTCLISIKSLNFMSSASQDFWERAGGNPEQIHRLSCEFQKTWAVATGPLAQSVLSGRSNLSHHSEELRSVGDAGVCHQDSSVYISDSARLNTVFFCPFFDHQKKSLSVFSKPTSKWNSPHWKRNAPAVSEHFHRYFWNVTNIVVLDITHATLFPWRPGRAGSEGLKGLMKWNSVPMGSWASAMEGRTKTKKTWKKSPVDMSDMSNLGHDYDCYAIQKIPSNIWYVLSIIIRCYPLLSITIHDYPWLSISL